MKFDLPAGDEAVSDFVSIPAGTYVCEIAEVRAGTTRSGDPRWAMRLVVAEGEHTGRHAAWDGIVFSTRGRARARRILGALGLPNSGTIDISPADLTGRRALVEVRPSEFETPTGVMVRRNEVPYDGYRPLQDDASGGSGAAGASAGADAGGVGGRRLDAVDPSEIPF